jgi:Concanavalin A-like lectin/glucanases superfamily
MSWTFDGVDDLVSSGAKAWGSIFSVSVWVNPTTLGESSQGFIVAHGPSATPRFGLHCQSTPNANSFQIRVGRATDGVWRTLANVVVLGTWQHLVVTYDGSVVSNPPIVYYNGQPITLQTTVSPAGALTADTQVVYIGNNSAGARTVEGSIGEVAVWPYILSPVAAQNVYLLGVLAEPGYLNYWPGDGAGPQEFPQGTAGLTVTGALAGENPPGRPAGRLG